MDKVCKTFEVDFDYFFEKPRLKQVNKDSSVGYLAENQTINISDKLIEQYEHRLKEKDETIAELKAWLKRFEALCFCCKSS